MCHLRLAHKDEPTLTKRDIENQRRLEMIEDNTNKFGEQSLGIHGQDLPHYSAVEGTKQWWKYHPHGSPTV